MNNSVVSRSPTGMGLLLTLRSRDLSWNERVCGSVSLDQSTRSKRNGYGGILGLLGGDALRCELLFGVIRERWNTYVWSYRTLYSGIGWA